MKHIIINEITSNYFTNLNDIFEIIGDEMDIYNCLITDYEFNLCKNDLFLFQEKNYIWIKCSVLRNIVKNQPIQLIWGIISFFDSSIKKEKVLSYPLPNIETYFNHQYDDTLCNPLSVEEWVSVDSSYLSIKSRSDSHIKKIYNNFPKSKIIDNNYI